MDNDDLINKAFPGLENAEAWIVFVRNDFPVGFRYGPYSPQDCGRIIERMLAENVKGHIMLNCGPVIDWAMIKEFCPTVEVKGDGK